MGVPIYKCAGNAVDIAVEFAWTGLCESGTGKSAPLLPSFHCAMQQDDLSAWMRV